MTEQEMQQLDQDLRRSVKAEVYGPKQPHGGFKGMRPAPRAKGYHVWFDLQAQVVKIGRDRMDEDDYIKPIAEVGEIHVWTDDRGPSIFWTRGADGELKRRGD